jgi:hypothetical protein
LNFHKSNGTDKKKEEEELIKYTITYISTARERSPSMALKSEQNRKFERERERERESTFHGFRIRAKQ